LEHSIEKQEKTENIFDRVWKFFASVKLAIFVLIFLALTSIIGTIVEQRAEAAKNITLLAKFFGDNLAPSVYNVFVDLGFMDMYRSWWFVGLLLLFSINLIVCSLERFPKTLRLIRTPMRPLGEKVVRTLPVRKEIQIKAGLRAARDEVFNVLNASRYRVLESSSDEAVQLYAQKWGFTRLGVYVVHLSILLIFIGAIIGAWFGFGGYLNLPEGGSSSVIYTGPGKSIPLGFTVKCNWYDTQYYSGTDAPQDFMSELVVFDNGKEVMKRQIEVNSPLTYKGITFFQSSYGMIPNSIGEFVLGVAPRNGQPKELRLVLGDRFEIPGTGVRGTIKNYSPALSRDPRTGALTTYGEQMTNPAIAIEIEEPGREKYTGWFLKRYPSTWILPGSGHKIEFRDYWGVEYTGLQVSKDPGVWLVYFACTIMTIGLYACFFMSHRKIWISIIPESAGKRSSVRILAGGTTSKNKLAFERHIEHIVSKVSISLKQETSVKK
jgi:cytochrome c biogenesis protein